ncbi:MULTISPECIES: MTH865 family protein [Methanosarcina]|uniref:MTH865-like family protein n=3 Tax=Methanosarcina barkeri TaxID=2208 RepID=A0A0E3QRG2_METBA|nr:MULTISPECIES: MTH865 family protein [Methanosarcina]AKB53378.1 hypothetical protein MSBRM_0380 [Methanosarcina barkeri MS]AKB58517.1 hypothetical protein MSBR2_2001 [Methanosarcina barkeri 227]AKJ39308.1 hypothetical protein MCM1_2291 [Methanosarcina barkeri CM1]OED09794.1 hypothetical protein A9239_08050 [Methanosarcina sp. A14]
MGIKEEVYEQIIEILKDAKFPINTMDELIAALPEGLDTTGRIGGAEVTAREAEGLITEKDFPLKDAKYVADLLIERAGL